MTHFNFIICQEANIKINTLPIPNISTKVHDYVNDQMWVRVASRVDRQSWDRVFNLMSNREPI